jgi:hypothetical protein
MLETSYTLNLRQLFKVAPKLNKYFWRNIKLKKTKNLSIITTKKQVSSSIPKVWTIDVTIDNHMVVIQI